MVVKLLVACYAARSIYKKETQKHVNKKTFERVNGWHI